MSEFSVNTIIEFTHILILSRYIYIPFVSYPRYFLTLKGI